MLTLEKKGNQRKLMISCLKQVN